MEKSKYQNQGGYKMKTKMVFKLSVAMALKEKGHEILDKIPNRNNPKLQVFIFKETDEFIRDLKGLIGK